MLSNPTTITKYCATLIEAEELQQSLYDKYDSVELIDFPRFTENGVYTFKVN